MTLSGDRAANEQGSVSGSAQHAADTFVAQLMRSKVAVGLLSAVPIPLSLVRPILARDNARENRKDSWQRLRVHSEAARYGAVRTVTERYARDGFVLDIGCSQGILQEGLRYGRYLGVDNCEQSVRLARAQVQPLDSVCMRRWVLLRRRPATERCGDERGPLLPTWTRSAVEHHARRLAPGGVVIISIYARTWSSRRLLRAIGERLELLESNVIRSGHLALTVQGNGCRG